MSYNEFASGLRRECKALGVKLKIETLSWGPHASFLVPGPEGMEPHRVGNVAPSWWSSEHVALMMRLDELRSRYHAMMMESGLKVYGVMP